MASFGAAQLAFIKAVRGEIDKNQSNYFHSRPWNNITPSGGRFDSTLLNVGHKRKAKLDSFYVKPNACWVPHLLFSNHVPCCPHCKKNDYVDPAKGRWINNPKVLFGLHRNRYLDTWLYPCRGCARSFAGYNKQSLQLDAAVYYGFFNFFVSHGYAVDEEAYRHVILESTTESTAGIAKRMERMAYDAYFADYQLYLSAVGLNKIDNRPRKKRQTLDSYVTVNSGENIDDKLQRLLSVKATRSSTLTRARLAYNGAKAKANTDVSFQSLLSSKDNHNVHGRNNQLPGLGSTKIRRLVNHGILTAFKLLAADPEHPELSSISHLIPVWQDLVLEYYEKYHAEARVACTTYELAKVDNENAMDDLVAYQSSLPPEHPTGAANDDTETGTTNSKPPLFSKFDDRKGYNGRPLSKHRIDSIVTTVFNHRKSFQQRSMMGLTAEILKIDFNYKIARKIRVWLKQGQSFSPFKCIVTVQNEDGLTVFWKALKHSESFAEIKADLNRLRKRLNLNMKDLQHDGALDGEAVKVIFVDNCCGVHRILSLVFIGALIKLDAFHWLKRCNDILAEPTSAKPESSEH